MQASLPKELVPIGAATLLTIISTSCSIFLAVGQAVFQSSLRTNLAPIVSSDTIDAIISVGATNVGSVVDAQDFPLVIQAYGKAITQVFVSSRFQWRSKMQDHGCRWLMISQQYVPAGAPVISFILVAFCSWTTTKKNR